MDKILELVLGDERTFNRGLAVTDACVPLGYDVVKV